MTHDRLHAVAEGVRDLERPSIRPSYTWLNYFQHYAASHLCLIMNEKTVANQILLGENGLSHESNKLQLCNLFGLLNYLLKLPSFPFTY